MAFPQIERWPLQVIAVAIPDPVAVVDLQGRVVAWNLAMASAVETPPGVALGHELAALEVSHRLPPLRGALEDVKRTLETVVLSAVPFPGRSGGPAIATVTLTPIRDHPHMAILIHVAAPRPGARTPADIEQLEAENERLLAGNEQLLALNEELRAARDQVELELERMRATHPEAALRGKVAAAVLGLAGARCIDGDAVERAFTLLIETPRLEPRVLEELEDLRALTTGRVRLERGPVALDTVAVEAADHITEAVNTAGIRLDVTAPERVIVRADRGRLQQVTSTLVGNAVRFTSTGGRVVIAVDRHGPLAKLTVADSGCGLPLAFLAHAFEPFYHSNGRGPAAHRGLGLRLALARHVVDLHGGTIRATSRGDGLGTTMMVSLPSVAAS